MVASSSALGASLSEVPRVAPLALHVGDHADAAQPAASGFLPEETPERLEELFQKARHELDVYNAMPYFEALAARRHGQRIQRADFHPAKRSIVTSFQPKSGGTFLHNRLLEIGYQEFWWFFPHHHCHSYCFGSDQTLELYLAGGAACHSHFRPSAGLLAALDRCDVDKVWVHLRNPAETAVSAYHHFRGEGQGSGELGDERRREALRKGKAFSYLQRLMKSRFLRAQIDWHIDWVAQWLRYEELHPGKVVFSFHREMTDSQRMLDRVFSEFGVEQPGRITTHATGQDRFRENPHRNWRTGLRASATRSIEQRVGERLGEYVHFERLWS